MKLDVDVNEVTLSGVGATGEFRIRNSAKAFKILSDGLYSNKIRAIIRELSCNAVDSHIAAGKEDVQFEVHLPTVLEPYFAVRDFGLGLSGDQVTSIYTTYFESTKTDSNAFIGALGLGSKSPFSYTENFTITAIKDGMKRIYSAFINDAGVPCVAEMSTELSDEGNGVEVKFSVTNRYDYDSFRHEASEVFKWFKKIPKITGASVTIRPVEFKERDIVSGVHTMENNNGYYGAPSVAIMGNIAYPLNKIPEPQKHFGNLAPLLECGLALEFSIGDLDFAASREELSYIPLTLNSIKAKLKLLNDNLVAHLAAKADSIENEWERAAYLSEQSQSRLYRGAVPEYVTQKKFKLYNPSNHYGRFEFEFDDKALKSHGLEITAFRSNHGSSSKITVTHQRYAKGSSATLETISTIPVASDAIFVLNDLKTGCQARARFHYNLHRSSATVYCVNCTDELDNRQAHFDWLMKQLHNPPKIIKASELDKPVKKKPTSTQGILYLRLKTDRCAGYEDSYTWQSYTDALDENTNYYYVALSNYQPQSKDGSTSFNVQRLRAWMDDCGIPAISNIRIIGVRQNRIKELQELDNWIWIEDKIREEIAKVKDSQITQMVSAEMVDNYTDRIYTNDAVAKAVGPDSEYAKYVTKYGKMSRTGNVSSFVQLCAQYGRSVQVDAVKTEIGNAKAKVLRIYPLIKYLHNAKEHEVIQYVKLVDTQQEKI